MIEMFVPESIIIAEGSSTAATKYLGGTTAMAADVTTGVRDLIDESAAAVAVAAAAASEISSKNSDRRHACACSLSMSYHTPVFYDGSDITERAGDQYWMQMKGICPYWPCIAWPIWPWSTWGGIQRAGARPRVFFAERISTNTPPKS